MSTKGEPHLCMHEDACLNVYCAEKPHAALSKSCSSQDVQACSREALLFRSGARRVAGKIMLMGHAYALQGGRSG